MQQRKLYYAIAILPRYASLLEGCGIRRLVLLRYFQCSLEILSLIHPDTEKTSGLPAQQSPIIKWRHQCHPTIVCFRQVFNGSVISGKSGSNTEGDKRDF